MLIREALKVDLDKVLSVERAAFGSDEEAKLVSDLMGDESAKPIVSLLAIEKDQAVGHIMFTKACLEPKAPLSLSILAPLAVVPDSQGQGIGGKLIEYGLKALSDIGIDLVFVLGYPEYYSRHGFKPAGKLGFAAPYPIAEKNADAWMVQALNPEAIRAFSGKVVCAKQLDKPEYWIE
jgi:putative acetyltransferase